MQYQRSSSVSGAWVKGSEVVSGTRCKLVSETKPVPSQFKDKNGATKNQDVTKIRFEGEGGEAKNISLNRATINALIEAFGEDSVAWQGQLLTAQTEKVVVSGRRVTAVYLVPEGFEVGEDENGYVVIKRKGEQVSAAPVAADDEINPDDIPF